MKSFIIIEYLSIKIQIQKYKSFTLLLPLFFISIFFQNLIPSLPEEVTLFTSKYQLEFEIFYYDLSYKDLKQKSA